MHLSVHRVSECANQMLNQLPRDGNAQDPTTFSLASASKVIDSIMPLEIPFPAFPGGQMEEASKLVIFSLPPTLP